MRLRWALYLAMADGVRDGRVHHRRIDANQRGRAHGGHAGFPAVELEFRCGRRCFRHAGKPHGGELRIGIGSAGRDGRIRRHAGIGGPFGFGGIRRPDVRLGLFSGERLCGRSFDAARLPVPAPRQLSEDIFNGSSAFIVLRNEGPDVTLGSSALRFAAGFIRQPVGGTTVRRGAAWLGGPGKPGKSGPFDEFGCTGGPGCRFRRCRNHGPGGYFWGEAYCCAGSRRVLARLSRGRPRTARKINRLHPLIHSDTIYMADRNPPLEVPQIHNGVTKSTE